jgi:ribose transport system substrate-binding protein
MSKPVRTSNNHSPTGSGKNLDRYKLGTLDKGLTILELVERSSKPVGIQQVALATGIQRAAVYRLLCTLEQRGYVHRLENKKYTSAMRGHRFLIGYCAPLSGSSFRKLLATNIRRAAQDSNLDLLEADNREDDFEGGLRNAQMLVDARVDLTILFEPVESIGHAMADRLYQAGTAFITIDVPLQGGVYFGANNYQAGKLAGLALARFAAERWGGAYHRVVLVESSSVGPNVQARLTGVLVGLQERLGAVPDSHVIHLDGRSRQDHSREVVGALLSRLKPGSRLLISGFNDQTALGALQAARDANREKDVAVVGQNASEEGWQELRNSESRFIASIAYFPERYGSKVMQVAQSILNRDPVAPAIYTDHIVLDHTNLDRYYRS